MTEPDNRTEATTINNGKGQAKVNVVTTPLISRKPQKEHPAFRDINEDDDGYHPYCDGPEKGCQFERDPWY